jgi:hypothetical protein
MISQAFKDSSILTQGLKVAKKKVIPRVPFTKDRKTTGFISPRRY